MHEVLFRTREKQKPVYIFGRKEYNIVTRLRQRYKKVYQIDFHKPIKVHFIGIGGISMSGLAELLLDSGFTVQGSDSRKSALTDSLETMGAKIFIGQRACNITDDLQLVVYTAAIHPDNPEYMAAADRKIPMLTRAELLGQIMRNYDTPIAISGTHGKTTTTSMISQILLDAELDPTLAIGGVMQAIHGNMRIGKSGYFVTEACEYTNSFLSFYPRISLILNIEEDHLDFFKDIHDIRNSFHRFAKLLPEDGTLIINGDIDNLRELTDDLACRVVTYGLQNTCQYYASDITYQENGCGSFTIHTPDQAFPVTLSVPGEHNIQNAVAAAALATLLHIEPGRIADSLSRFCNADRRFQYKGSIGGVTIIDDYSHHPTEIRAALNTALRCRHNRLWCIFQPHTYTRTRNFFDAFAEALALADHVVLADIYAARETDTLGVSSRMLAEKITSLGTPADYFPTFDEIENFILQNCSSGDLLITMGAGDIVKVGEKLLGQ